jgi:hypothetical protein
VFIDAVAAVMLNVDVVAPLYTPALVMFVNPLPVFTCHWYVTDAPVADTPNEVLPPEQIVLLEGCVLILGKVFTVKLAELLVTDGVQAPLTTHW